MDRQQLLDALQMQLENPNALISPEQEQADLESDVDKTDQMGASLTNPVQKAIAESQAVSSPQPASQGPSDSDRLFNAQQGANKQAFYSNLLRSFQGALQGASGGKYKADNSVADSIDANAKSSLQNVKDQINAEAANRKEARDTEMHKVQMDDFQLKLAKSKLDFTDMQANNDPTSGQSKLAQDRVIQMQKEMGQPVNEQAVRQESGATLFKYFPFLQQDLTKFYQNQQGEAQRQQQSKENELERGFKERQLQESIAARKQNAEMANQNKLELQREKSQAKKDELEARGSEGQRAVDKDYAKHFNEFTATGSKKAEQSIAKMEKLVKELESDQGFGEAGGGRIASILPDAARSRDAIRRRDLAISLGNDTLKATFGAQLSDAEREAKAKEYYNDALDNKANAAILKQKIADSKAQLESERAKAQYYKDNKSSLRGFGGEALDRTTNLNPKDQEALDWANSNPQDPRAQKIKKRLGQ